MTKVADNFDDAMDGYGERGKFEPGLQGRLTEIPAELESPIRKVREVALPVLQLNSADEEIMDSDSFAEWAR